MRLVLDTNMVLSALLWEGLPYRLLQLAADGEGKLFTSPVLAAEFNKVLERPHLAAKLAEQDTTPDAFSLGFNRSMQHIKLCANRRSVADEAKTEDLLH